ncbi:MAG: MotA/TolQ/ExbB proton channel family protein, partial [Alistipes sp.]|nr:MotA/TolQ/ExbB proton channel family protein [Alistipes sp.]
MKKLFLVLAVAALSFSTAIAQEAATAAPVEEATVENAEAVATEAVAAEEAVEALNPETQIAGDSLHYVLMQKFLEGGWGWMLPILIVLVLGLAIAIERILFLGLSTINTKKFIAKVEKALNEGGIEAAKAVCRDTKGPIASIYWQGLDRYDQGLDAVE